jgi:N-acetylglucosaminyldiphosphoundecaprenol N-acetyl-beta-D-mannosaminyltransferase
MRFISEKIKQKIIANRELVIAIFLWFCVWGTYNTDISRIFSPGFPNGFFDLVHGLRSILPFIAFIYSGIVLFKNRYFFKNLFWSPIGLSIVYSLLGIISSIFSREPLMAMYWGILYGGVLFFLLVFLKDKKILKKIIIINFFIAGAIALVLTILFLAHPGAINSLTYNFLICSQRPYEGLGGLFAESDLIGMAGTRPTGLGRYAGITAIASLSFFFFTRKKFKINWFVLFAIFLAILLFSKGKTEMVAFIASIIFLIWTVKKINIFSIIGTIFIILISGIIIFYNVPCTNSSFVKNDLFIKNVSNANNELVQGKQNIVEIQQPETPKITSRTASVISLSGRTGGVWRDSWHLFLRNPLFGFGFQADRYFLNNQHAHNTIIHTLLQAGILGTLAFILAVIILLIYIIRIFKTKNVDIKEKQFLTIITAVLIFFAVRAITESVAFFSADWLFVAPIIAYIQCLNTKIKSNKKMDRNKDLVLHFNGIKINPVGMQEVLNKMSFWIKQEQNKIHWIVVTGMHGIVESHKNKDFKEMINSADFFVPDGISIVWLSKLKGFNLNERVSGADLMEAFFKVAEKQGFSNFFYGDSEDTLKKLINKVSIKYPNLKISGSYPSHFKPLFSDEDPIVIKKINDVRPDVLWVARGLPKQERWIYKYRFQLKVPIVVGVGAAFNFLSGNVKRAPDKVGKMGFEWLWRLIMQPKRMWRRVFLDGPLFIFLVFLDFIKNKKNNL